MARGLLKIPPDEGVYDDDPVRWGVIATIFWGVAGLAVGLYIALQLVFPALNLGIEYTSFGRLRPLHTSAVVFASGGNALIATRRSEEHTFELQSLTRTSYAAF